MVSSFLIAIFPPLKAWDGWFSYLAFNRVVEEIVHMPIYFCSYG